MQETGVCAVCGKHLGQKVGALALRHGHVYGGTKEAWGECPGYDVRVIRADEYPLDGWEL
jgi:hypothetical protein